jgi:hypothetical protein
MMSLMIRFQDLEPMEGEVSRAIVELDGHRMVSSVIGRLPQPVDDPVPVELSLDEVQHCRPCTDPQPDGFAAGSGFSVLRATVLRSYPHGSYDVEAGGRVLMLDQDELGGLVPAVGDRISLAFSGLVCVVDDQAM